MFCRPPKKALISLSLLINPCLLVILILSCLASVVNCMTDGQIATLRLVILCSAYIFLVTYIFLQTPSDST